ncbi:hypothetical protein BCR34DRAFT_568505 [Clohesyomyces aquaticus]|uniref:Uncharacterized protein n=1 Tax=Clohesyomyces aquaticus TaxID=1231657 RepID=A0A1Y1ZGM1_9PLEO|nr:hypothetical protein BCR34DRAFT_568505 [Clohesyomyces aquaticus]
MAFPRASTRALKHLNQQTRSLSMTGPAPSSFLFTSERPAMSSWRIPQLRDTSAEDTTTVRPPSVLDASNPNVRHFNTSRALKAVNDTSTIDFAYLPDYDPDTRDAPILRVPILPTVTNRSYAMEDVDEPVMLPQISTVSADGTHIYAPAAMSEVSDNSSVDFQGMAEHIASRIVRPSGETSSMIQELWTGLKEDILGPQTAKKV